MDNGRSYVALGLCWAISVATVGDRQARCDDTRLSEVFGGSTGDRSYRALPRTRDQERRCERMAGIVAGDACDVTALAGMPGLYVSASSEYIKQILASIQAVPLKRRHFWVKKEDDLEYPLVADAVYDRDIQIPVIILPRPKAVSRYSQSNDGKVFGWCPMDYVEARQ